MKDGNDEMATILNPDLYALSDADFDFADTAYGELTATDSDLERLILYFGADGSTTLLDEIRIGTTLSSVTLFISSFSLGDADTDGDVDATDLATLGTNWDPTGTTKTWADGDFDGNGNVDASDLAMLGMNWDPTGAGAGAAYLVPEPATLGLLLVGGLALLRRRK